MPTQVSGHSTRDVSRSSSRRRLVAFAAGAAALAATGLLAGCGSGQVAQTAQIVPSVPGANLDLTVPKGVISVRDVALEFPGPQGYQAGQDAPLSLRIINGTSEKVTLAGVAAQKPDGTSAGTVVQVGGIPSAAPSGESALPAPFPTDRNPTAKPSASGKSRPGASSSASPPSSASSASSASSPSSASPSASGPAGSSTINVPVPASPSGLVVLSQATGGTYLELTGLTAGLSTGQSIRFILTFTLADGSTVQMGNSDAAGKRLLVPVAPPATALPRSPLSLSPAEG